MARSKTKTQLPPDASRPDAAEPPKKTRRGPKDVTFDASAARIVETCIGLGMTQDETRQLILNPKTGKPIERDTLVRYFGKEIEKAKALCDYEAGVSLRHLIRGRPAEYDAKGNLLRKEIPVEPSAVYFYHKTRRGWRETNALELSGPGGSAIKTEDVTKRARDKLESRITGVATRIGAGEASKTAH